MNGLLTKKNPHLSDSQRNLYLPKIQESEIFGKVMFVKSPKFLGSEIQVYQLIPQKLYLSFRK